MYQTILYPTDGSEGAEAVVDHVRELAAAFDATVHVLHVVDARSASYGLSGAFLTKEGSGVRADPAPGDGSGMVGEGTDAEATRSALVEHGEEIVEATAASLRDGEASPETVTAVETGTPHSAILEYASANDVDLVVMGTHGRTGVERYLLGSVAEKVVRLSDVPVTTVRADA
ncbi:MULTISPECIES: universal stress protein [Halorubrum]|uniref:Nucleotide-binding universal stress protein, UspA family n=1 Tax=Halorubrum sodomense TaxID=35743 RepID=A0A1I6GNW7_HALSD|nr:MULTISPECIES: universal stress protein [Halorubrum]TKX55235.1 universal stress protein [Halorubrum sp. SP3]TKX70295.1 universal stress protein [Halorubrum sp. SP9]SFR43925.1 Nucleotide-binding universal stress protein, UspA family [Halorubrum sodomense]